MKLRKTLLIILALVLFSSLSGCGNKKQVVESSNKKVEVAIDSKITEYSPLMSSIPGIPLTANYKSKIKQDNIKFHWITEEGTFLVWNKKSGKTRILGNDIKINNEKIYWAINSNEKLKKIPFKIYLKIENEHSSKVICESSIQIEQNKKNWFTIKK
ncbi:hypothetical protein [Clostridium oryzae]|uniref:Lipoprotein n=1 Tax=Clostridium oryzae TaxID=1450648 RepID=A0A1V4I3W3_9CLOT|nr:hypothetical protein [Clostridium oryzae]OPJ54589.1 hypothetical protein CLORY_45520 [Clostridium oryzae]